MLASGALLGCSITWTWCSISTLHWFCQIIKFQKNFQIFLINHEKAVALVIVQGWSYGDRYNGHGRSIKFSIFSALAFMLAGFMLCCRNLWSACSVWPSWFWRAQVARPNSRLYGLCCEKNCKISRFNFSSAFKSHGYRLRSQSRKSNYERIMNHSGEKFQNLSVSPELSRNESLSQPANIYKNPPPDLIMSSSLCNPVLPHSSIRSQHSKSTRKTVEHGLQISKSKRLQWT